tara:strand:- start:1096 stop:2388 length:1293 start_codon:yes stop_codon:yes gene_type:complete
LNKFNSNTNTIEDISKINKELNINRIIKLPIDCIELDKEFNLENYWTYNPIIKEPEAYDNNNNYFNLETIVSNKNNTNLDIKQNNNLNKINNNLSLNIENNNINNSNNINNFNNFNNSNNLNNTNNLNNINNLHNINNESNSSNTLNESNTFNALNKSNALNESNTINESNSLNDSNQINKILNNKISKKNEKHNNTTLNNKSNNTIYQDKINELLEDLDDTNKNKNLSQIEILLNKKYNQIKKIPLYNFKNEQWPTKSSCPCFWCNHKFDNTPWGIPNKYENNSFVLFGNFCSPNCALSYLIVRENNINLFEKISLLNLLYYYVYNNDSIIVPAPDKICIDTYGGPFTISQFRYLTLNNNKKYNIIFPSCNLVNPIFEETKKSVNQNNYYIPIDKNRINKIQTELKIKRSKPINNIKNTLDNCMTIIYN